MNIMPKRFVGLHAHSGFSTFDGLGYPKEHMEYVLDNGMDAWALTDHGHMNSYAHAQSHQVELSKAGRNFKYIPGIEFYLHPDLEEWARAHAKNKEKKDKGLVSIAESSTGVDEDAAGSIIENETESKQSKTFDTVRRRHHLVALAKSQKGLNNLFSLVSKSYAQGFYRFPRVDFQLLKQHGEDIILSSACLGGILAWEAFRHHQDLKWNDIYPGVDTPESFRQIQLALENTVDRIIDCVGRDNFFLELQFNKLAPQHFVNQHLIQLSKSTGIPLIATADSHYPDPALWKDREMYKKLGHMSFDKLNPGLLPQSVDELECELYPKNAEQMWNSYKDSAKHVATKYPNSHFDFYDDVEVCDAIERTYDIAHDMINDTSPNRKMKLPTYVVPEGVNHFNALVEAVKAGLIKRGVDGNQEYLDRAKEELLVIKAKDYALYFLTMKAIMDIANENMLCGPGRGSAAGSLVNYVLGITHVDPLKYGLLFARFMSMARHEEPDIDCLDSTHLVRCQNNQLKQISQLQIGDYVLDMNSVPRKVTFVVNREVTELDEMQTIIVESGGTYGTIVCTNKHRLMLYDGSEIFVHQICEDTILHSASDFVRVIRKEINVNTRNVTDITVEDSHTFQVVPFDSIKYSKDKCQYLTIIDTYITDELFNDKITEILDQYRTIELE